MKIFKTLSINFTHKKVAYVSAKSVQGKTKPTKAKI